MIENIKKSLEEIVAELKNKHLELNQKASGKWIDSLEVEVSDINNIYKGVIKGEDYTEYLTKGRMPNKKSSEAEIRKWAVWAGKTFIKDWVKAKGLPHDPIAVAYNIAKKGTRIYRKGGSDLIDGVLTKERVEKLENEIGTMIMLQVADKLKRILQTA